MSTVFTVTEYPTFGNGDDSDHFRIGDRVTVNYPEPDEDGDVHAYKGSDSGEWHYIALSCLTPVAPSNDIERVSVRALRVYLAVIGTTSADADTVVSAVSAIDTALLD